MRPPRLCLSLFPLLQVRTLRSLPWLCGLLSAWQCVCWCCSSLWLPSAAGRSRRAARRPEEKVRPAAESRASCSAQMQTIVKERKTFYSAQSHHRPHGGDLAHFSFFFFQLGYASLLTNALLSYAWQVWRCQPAHESNNY